MEKQAPWLTEYLSRPGSIPKSDVINKWSGDITIGIDIPSIPVARARFLAGKGNPYAAYYPEVLQQHISRLLPDLKKATGRSVNLIMPGDPRDSDPRTYARIRIVADESVNGCPGCFSYHPLGDTRQLWAGVPFENSDRAYLKGYLLPHADNGLGLAICEINFKLPLEPFKRAVTECVVRALGLPGMLGTSDGSVLGKRDTPSAPANTAMSVNDLRMIALLYCPAIEPGMSRNEAMEVLAGLHQCTIE